MNSAGENAPMTAKSSPAHADAIPARLPLTSTDPLAPRYEQLKALFPSAVTDGRVDLERLRALMGEQAATGPERYGLSWAGKSDALKTLRQLTTATLLPAPSESVNWDTTGNAIIEGDNLEVLKILQHAYHGKVKLIYIDPPYNTGGDFVYPDDYSEGLSSYQLFTRQVNEEGVKLTTNVNTSGRYHSRWLTMMYPRLFLARNLLREDGVIFVSIDDHEVHNLRLVMDEIFGEENFLIQLVWHRRKMADSRNEDGASTDHEYVIAYTRSETGRLRGVDIDKTKYQNPDSDERGPWFSADLTGLATREQRPNLHYDIVDPKTGLKYPPSPTRGWSCAPATMAVLIKEKRIIWPAKCDGRPRHKKFLNEITRHQTGFSSMLEVGPTTEGTHEIQELFGEKLFAFPKPVELVHEFINQVMGADDLVLDFFAGSGTTAHAVLAANREDGGNRKFILVQLPEPTGRKDFPTIAEITKERVRRVIKQLDGAGVGELALGGGVAPDRGFKVFKLAPSNFAVWDPALAGANPEKLAEQWQLSADNVRGDVQEQALLYELMLKCGLPLASRIEVANAAGIPVYRLDEGKLVVCLARVLTREALQAMIALQPQSVLCLDVGFKGNDALKVNAQLECQSHGIQFRTA
jgi:adenine-specific DNA-methyltransferase